MTPELDDYVFNAVVDHGLPNVRAVMIENNLANAFQSLGIVPPWKFNFSADDIPVIVNGSVFDLKPFEVALMNSVGGLLERRTLALGTNMARTRNLKWRTLRWDEATTGMRVRCAGGQFNVGMVGSVVDSKGDNVTVMYKGGDTHSFKFNRLQVDISSIKNQKETMSISDTVQKAWKQYITDTGLGPKHGYLAMPDFVTLKQELEKMERQVAINPTADPKRGRANFIITLSTDKGFMQLTTHPNVPMKGSEVLFATKNLVDIPVDNWNENIHGFRRYVLSRELGPVTVSEAAEQLALIRKAVEERQRKAPWNI